jgi:signal transduction histidine kinase
MTEAPQYRNKSLLLKLQHELRQSLHSIMGLLELASEETSSPAQAVYLSQCRSGADQLLQVANDVAELASTDRLASSGEIFCLSDMVEEVAGVMAALAHRKGLEFSWSVDPSVPKYVFSERDTIQDMLRRILDNSIKYTAHGSIALSVTSAAHQSVPPGSAGGRCRDTARTAIPSPARCAARALPTWPVPNTTCSRASPMTRVLSLTLK